MTSLNPATMAFLIGISLLVLMVTGFPVAFCMLTVAIGGYIVFVGPHALSAIYSAYVSTMTTDVLIAVPLFMFMASVFQVSGIGSRMYDSMYKWMAGLRGGLAIGTVIISTMIAAMTGLIATATITMGLLAYPEMRKRGYDKEIAIGSIMGGGCLGPIIPPSVPFILVSSLTGVSSGKLFMAGVGPGLLISLFMCIYIGTICYFRPHLGPPVPVDQRATWREKSSSLSGLVFPILLVILVLGGIYKGIFTPTEAGGIGAAGGLVATALLGNLNWKNVLSAVKTTFRATAMVLWICFAGSAFSSLTGSTGIKGFVASMMTALPLGPYGILTIMIIILFVMGCFIDTNAIIMIALPIMMPVAVKLGFDPLFFALLFSLDVILGALTPPFGYALFYFRGLNHPDVSMMDIYRAGVRFFILMFAGFVLTIIFPEIALWLPTKMIH